MSGINRLMKFLGNIKYLLKLNFRMRYSGTKIGKMWAFLSPALQIGMYAFVFGFVMNEGVAPSYILWLVLGYGSWLTITDGILSSTNSIIMGKPILKNFQIRAECFSIAASLMGFPSLLITLLAGVLILIFAKLGVSIYMLWLFLLIPLMFLLIMGLGLVLSTLTVFVRDIYQILNVALMGLLFLSPIFYDIALAPPILQRFAHINPIYNLCNLIRVVVVSQQNIELNGLLNIIACTAVLWLMGLGMLKKYGGYFEAAL